MAFLSIKDLLKGAFVSLGCLIGITYQDVPEAFDDPAFAVFALIALAIGVGLGAMATVLRRDRVLVLTATTFSLMLAPLVAIAVLDGHTHWDPDSTFTFHPWLLAGAVVLAWWTRPPQPEPALPAARMRAFRLVPRKLTAIEISTLLSVSSAIVIVLGGDQVQDPDLYWYTAPEVDLLPTLAAALVVALPLGVGVGAVAGMSQLRIPMLLVASSMAAGYGALCLVSMLAPFEPAAWSPLVIIAATLTLERTTRKP